jgi:hypothetical protein
VVKGWYDAENNAFTDNSVLTSDTTLYVSYWKPKYGITLVDTGQCEYHTYRGDRRQMHAAGTDEAVLHLYGLEQPEWQGV